MPRIKATLCWATAKLLLLPSLLFAALAWGFHTLSFYFAPAAVFWARDAEGEATIITRTLIEEGSTMNPDKAIVEPANVPESRKILDIPIESLPGEIIALDHATACCFRLVNCATFVSDCRLEIIEYPLFALESISFAAISYPWRDLQMGLPGTMPPEGSFSVKGAEHADQISIDVLRTACLAAIHFGSDLIWLDRLCIIQDKKEDKNWQIQRMFRIYSECRLCLVLPGGLVRLPALSEPTAWVDRAWTLQEASAPKNLKCLFSFKHETYNEFLRQECFSIFSPQFREFLEHCKSPLQDIIEPRKSAACDVLTLLWILKSGVAGFKYHEPTLSQRHDFFPIRILHTPAAIILSRALQVTKSPLTLWISAFTRSSSRPVDMVFSLMGLLGVNLDVSKFDADERIRASVALLKAQMENGGAATWLYIAPKLKPSSELSILPTLPATSESGRAYMHTAGGIIPAFEALGAAQQWESAGAPKGRISDAGYFQFNAKAVLIREEMMAGDVTKSVERYSQASTYQAYNHRETYAIQIGTRTEYNKDYRNGGVVVRPPGPPIAVIELTFMIVEKHGYNLFHRVGMEREIDQKDTLGWPWVVRDFNVGGPGGGEEICFKVTPTGPVYNRQLK